MLFATTLAVALSFAPETLHSRSFVAPSPSFAISLYREYRGKGIGTEIMRKMLTLLAEQGWKQASLAVQKVNDAVRMYEAVGFWIVDENAEEYIMVREL